MCIRDRERGDLLEPLGQLARHGQQAGGSADLQQVGQRRGQPVRRFEHHHRRRQRAPGAQPALARHGLGRRKAGEGIGGILVGGDAAAHQRGDHGAGTGHRHHREAGLAHRAHHARAGIADRRRAGVRHQRHALALGQALADGLRRGGFVVPMRRHQRRADAPGVQQRAAGAGVFGGDHVGALQRMPGAQPQVAQIADRCGHHIQRRGGPMLPGHAFSDAGPGIAGHRG